MRSFILPSALSAFCLAASVAGQWTGSYNTTDVPRGQDPAAKCWIDSLDSSKGDYTAVYPCTCTGGKVAPDCNWKDVDAIVFNSVRDATCKCATTKSFYAEPEELLAYGKSQPNAVRQCICDPGKEPAGADGLLVPAPNCWCPSKALKENSGLQEATAPAASPVAIPSDLKDCHDEIEASKINLKANCDQILSKRLRELPEDIKPLLPSCTFPRFIDVCGLLIKGRK
ncbi:hypothetical protein IF1G_08693 [Cordyceps javanica]|uniref:Uncharacterized protein n=1 Tax=Cordyceps javanica TaxID=43265 RepID=A0A545VNH1_9HYPO|nr:hypothetical protein IF1G_08693 [Cordyceps javanica]TQW03272.1 hypothetical protein IF2G_09001 [Cordyceps javanica]